MMPIRDLEHRRAADRDRKRRQRIAERRAKMIAAIEAGDADEPPGRDELLRLLGVRARAGSVVAIRMLLERIERQRDAGPPASGSVIADLMARRAKRK